MNLRFSCLEFEKFVNEARLVRFHIFFITHTTKLTPAYFLEKKKFFLKVTDLQSNIILILEFYKTEIFYFNISNVDRS